MQWINADLRGGRWPKIDHIFNIVLKGEAAGDANEKTPATRRGLAELTKFGCSTFPVGACSRPPR